MRLPPEPSSVGQAREMVRRSLSQAGRGDLTEAAELLVSEVVTNALVHAGTPIDVALSVEEDGLRVEVGDGSPHLPARRTYGPTAGTGRGLMMLEGMVDDWGVIARPGGKTVWFELDGERVNGDHVPKEPARAGHDASALRTTQVELLNVPLLLHAAWQQHAEALLREHLLAQLDSEGDFDPIQDHADASDAMALLAGHIPRPDVSDDPDQLMSAAVDPLMSEPVVQMPVPLTSVASFDTLHRSLESAMAMADAGRYLTPPTQPELRALRRWLCHEVAAQSAGASPTPWSPELEAPLSTREAPDWDASSVASSTRAVVAADDTSRILAVSTPAAELMGYESTDQLVGRRLVVVIPPRYRQAHLAGLTLHVLTGRGPMLGRAIVVPVLCAGGQERLVELVIDVRSAPHGRVVYVAAMRAASG
jgi:PAS domain S-box-containing protein